MSTTSHASVICRWCCAVVLLIAILLLHGWQTIALFPSWRTLTDDRPIISVDHAIHLYHGYLGGRFLLEHGTSWGYDPFFMAGYPKTPVYDSSSGPAELFALATAGQYSPRAYKWGVVTLVLLTPVAVGLAAWTYGAGRGASLVTTVWAVWYFWLGFPGVLVRSGLVAFVWASGLAVLVPALLVKFVRAPSLTAWFLLTLTLTLGIQAHAILVLIIFTAAAVAYMQALYRLSWRWHTALWGALIVSLSVTFFWWWPLLRFISIKTGSNIFMKAEYWGFIWDYYLREGRVPALLVIFGIVGLIHWWRQGSRLAALVLAGQISLLMPLTFAGSMWSITQHLEPLRFQVPLVLAWCVPAGSGFCQVLSALNPRLLATPGVCRWRWGTAACLCISLGFVTTPSAWWWYQTPVGRPPSTWQLTIAQLRTARPLAVGLRPEMENLVEWIKRHTDNSARILLEDQLRLWEVTEEESLHWTPLLPILTGREFIGGLYQLAFIKHHQIAFGDWHLRGRHIRDWTPDEIRVFCQLAEDRDV